MIHFWMIPSMLLNHPKLDDLYDPLLDQANSGLQKIRGQLAYVSVENFRIHCSLFLALKNIDKKFGLSLHALHL